MAKQSYTPNELMVAAAAREIGDGERVFVGMRLPLLAFILAKKTHAPHAVGLFENGVVRDEPPQAPIITMGDPPNIHQAVQCASMMDIMGYLQKGWVDAGFIGGAEVDRFGNINTTWVHSNGKAFRLTGSGGGADIASLSGRLIIIMKHEKRRLVERVSYLTSPGYGEGGDWRKQVGLKRGGPSVLITTMGIFRFPPPSHEAVLVSIHPGGTLQEIKSTPGFLISCDPDLQTTAPPASEELICIRKFDPKGFWTGRN